MAVKLGQIPTEPYWLELVHGVRLYVEPLDTGTYHAARAAATSQVRRLLEEAREVEEAGGEVTGLPDPDDEDARVGLSQKLFIQALARMAIRKHGPDGESPGWEGVQAADAEEPAEVTDESVNDLMRIHAVAEDFLVKYLDTYQAVLAEKNGSSVAVSGIGAAAPITADDAQTEEIPAPEGDD